MRIAYLINQYPKISHSFIRREIQALERQRVHVMRIAIRGWNERNALEVALTPSLQGGKLNWNCKGYPVSAMPTTCGGR